MARALITGGAGFIGSNLAARLQGLTRDLEASLVIDALTRERAGAAAEGFLRHRHQSIKGLDEPLDVWARPLDPP